MVAGGSLFKVWPVGQQGFASVADLTGAFENYFGKKWGEVLAGKDLPFAYHLGWEAYFAVAGLTAGEGRAVASLTADLKSRGTEAHNIIIG